MLLPAKAEVARQLNRYRAWERVMLAAPSDRSARDSFEDSGYTLCVLMGKRCAREAAHAAERYLRTSLVAYLRKRRPRPREPFHRTLSPGRPPQHSRGIAPPSTPPRPRSQQR